MAKRKELALVLRSVVALNVSLSLIFFFVVLSLSADDKAVNVLSWQGYGAIVHQTPVLNNISWLIYLGSAFGLFSLQRWAFVVFLVSILLQYTMSSLGGLRIASGFEWVLAGAISTVDGAILVLGYFFFFASQSESCNVSK